MLMTLGMFVFKRESAPYQSLSHDTQWRVAKNERVGAMASCQFVGPGDDTITLSGVLYPEITGGDVSLTGLRSMAHLGQAWPLIEGTGTVLGFYVVTALSETRSEFFADGKARKIEFSLSLQKTSGGLSNLLASFNPVSMIANLF
ncbi:MAG: phage tail protein [Aeromonas sp.]